MKNSKDGILGSKILEKLLIIFMMIQPILDIYYLYIDEVVNVFKFSPSTIIRMIFWVVLLVLCYLRFRNRDKVKWIISFILVYGIYVVFHHMNSMNFSKDYLIYNNYDVINEIFYIIRMIVPLSMIFIIKEVNLSDSKIKRIIYAVINIFCITIVVTNIAKISLTSYSDGDNIIAANIFEWFNKEVYKKYTYELIASKGIFHMANQISALLVALLPIELYYIFKEDRFILKVIGLILNILAMIMIGTRVASYGWLLIMILMIVEYIYFGIVKEYKINIKKILTLVIILLMFCIILPYSPVSNRTYASDFAGVVSEHIYASDGEEIRKNICVNLVDKECMLEKIEYIDKYYGIYGFDSMYIENIYPYTDDTDFWFDSFDIPYVERADHRQLKTMITKRMISLNDNSMDYLLGISFTRLRNSQVYMENDIYVHLYSIGIVGIVLFILPYVIIMIYSLYKMFKNRKITFNNVVYLSSIVIIFIAGVASGNVFDEWIVTLFLGFICGLLLNSKEVKE